MASSVVSLLVEKQVAERVATLEDQFVQQARKYIIAALNARFPAIPLRIGQLIDQIHDRDRLDALVTTVLEVPDQAAAIAAIEAAARSASGDGHADAR